ncbi:hypothetical protein CCP1ISM_670006 [Azospirillaceae bacterium]
MTLDLITALTTIEDRLKRPAAPSRAERRALAATVATVRSGLLHSNPTPTPIDPRHALTAAIEAAAARGIGYSELVGIFNETVERAPRGR